MMNIRIGKTSTLERIEEANNIEMGGKNISFGQAKQHVIDRYAEEGIGTAMGSYWGAKEGISNVLLNLFFPKQLIMFSCVIDSIRAYPPQGLQKTTKIC